MDKKFGTFNSTAGRAPQSIVRKPDKFPVVNIILTKSADRYAHSVFVIYIKSNLRSVIFLKIFYKLFRSCR